jgi:hypothetical protein
MIHHGQKPVIERECFLKPVYDTAYDYSFMGNISLNLLKVKTLCI